MRVRLRIIGLVLSFVAGAGVLAAVAVLAGWWSRTSDPVILNTIRVESAIEQSIKTQRHLSSNVSCPVNIVQKAGVVFKCIASVGGKQFDVVVTETDGKGHVVYVVT